MDDKKMLLSLKRGDEEGLKYFIDKYANYVNTIIYNIIGTYMSQSDFEEVSSDVFYILWKNARKIEEGKVKAYLSSVARKKSKEKLRQMGKEIPLEEDVIFIDELDVEREMEKKEEAQILRNMIDEMKEPDREIFLRHYYYYQTLAQIAEEMEINISTIKTKLKRGRERLKTLLQKGRVENEKENF